MPELYLVSEEKSFAPHPAQTNVPVRFSELSADENGRSVPALRRTEYLSGPSVDFHCSSVRVYSPTRFKIFSCSAVAGERRVLSRVCRRE